MNDQAIRFRLGVFVLSTLLLLAVLITLFGGMPTFFKKTKQFSIVFNNATGLAPGSPVKKSGVKIGEVRTVKLDDETGKVIVGIDIEADYNIHKSDHPTLMSNLLGSDSYIAFLPPEDEKKVDNTIEPPGAILVGTMPTDPGQVLQKTSDLIPGAQDALVEIRKVFAKIDKMAPSMEAAIKDFSEVAKRTNQFIPELQQTNAEAQKFMRQANDAMPSAKRTIEESEVLVRQWTKVGENINVFIRENEKKLASAIDAFDDTTRKAGAFLSDENQRAVRDILKNVKNASTRFDDIAKNADELLVESRITMRTMNKTLNKADTFMDAIVKVTGPLGERGPNIMKNIEEASAQLNCTLKDARDLIQAVGRSEGTFQKFISDPSLYNNLNDTALAITRIMPRIDRTMKDVEIFADRIARHPELLGVSGVVRPASGLKEPPSFWPPR